MDSLRGIFNKLDLVMDGTPAIRFEDPEVLRILTTEKAYCDYNPETGNIGYLTFLDRDGDGMITKDEAAQVTLLSNRPDKQSSIFAKTTIKIFNEFQYFTGLAYFNSTFDGCNSLREVTLPILEEMGNAVFANSSIEKVIIPEGYRKIGDQILSGTNQCRLIDFPSTVESIGKNLLWGVKEITTIICRATIPPTLNGSFGYNGIPVAIYVPNESVAAYKAATNWSLQSGKIYPLSTYEEGY